MGSGAGKTRQGPPREFAVVTQIAEDPSLLHFTVVVLSEFVMGLFR